jgi:hypothetical protein
MRIMQLLNLLLFGLFLGLLAARFAIKRGRSPLIWFPIGFFFGLFGIAFLFLIPKVEKISAISALPRGAIPRRNDYCMKHWYYMDYAHAQQGPLEFPDLVKKWKERIISESSYVWGEGMSEWQRLVDLPEVLQELEQNW